MYWRLPKSCKTHSHSQEKKINNAHLPPFNVFDDHGGYLRPFALFQSSKHIVLLWLTMWYHWIERQRPYRSVLTRKELKKWRENGTLFLAMHRLFRARDYREEKVCFLLPHTIYFCLSIVSAEEKGFQRRYSLLLEASKSCVVRYPSWKMANIEPVAHHLWHVKAQNSP